MADDGFSPDACTVRHLSYRERAALKERFIARASEERQRLLRRWTMRISQTLHLIWRRIGERYTAAAYRFIARRERMAELRQLAGMSDIELRDIGLSRLEITAVARSGAAWPRGDRSSSAMRPTQGEKHAKGLLDRPRICS